LRSNSRASRARSLIAVTLAAALGAWASASSAPATDDVHIGITKNKARQIRLIQQSFVPAGDAAARAQGVTADGVLYDDLDHSDVCAVTRAWVKGETPFDVQAVIEPRVTVRGGSVTVSAEVKDFPAKQLIGKSEFKGPLSQARTLVHRLADDIVYQLTGERGIAETRIAFVAGGARDKSLYVVDADGFHPRALTKGGLALSPSWSPDGRQVAFSWMGTRGWSLYRVSSAGGKAEVLRAGGGLNIAPSFSPDGSQVAFCGSFEGNSEIYLIGSAGGSPRRLTKVNAIDNSPSWAPNGQRIAFTSDRGGSPQVYVMDADGGGVRRLVYGLSYTDSPDWSPKGDRIAFVCRSGGGFDIYVVDINGQDPRQVVTGGSNLSPRWAPDGRHLVFSSDRGGRKSLYVVDADGTRTRPLNVPGAEAKTPAWSPRPTPAATAVGSRAPASADRELLAEGRLKP
jgi:TolB protein